MFQQFKTASYAHAEYLCKTDLPMLKEKIEEFLTWLPLDKVYLETHRGIYDVPREKMEAIKELFASYGIKTSGGITSTLSIEGHEKHTIFDVLCYTDSVYRKRYLEIVRDTAKMFDEIILDDFFFTSCRCSECIEAKKDRSWPEYRLDLMAGLAEEIVAAAREENPDCFFIIKYPNWYESYQDCGYNPQVQRDIFDGIYTGVEARNPQYDAQHIQRYLSYSLIRFMEQSAPGRNGGGWFDEGGSSDNMNAFVEQASLALFAGARELTLFNFESMASSPLTAVLGQQLERMDQVLGHLGTPMGVSVYEPFDAEGEDQLMNYLGMCGVPLEPTPVFCEEAPSMLLTASSAKDPDVVEKLKEYVRKGGHAVITSGFLSSTMDRGIRDMTTAVPTGRRASGNVYFVDNYNRNHRFYCEGRRPVDLQVLDYKTNATWCQIGLITDECNFPLMLEDFYGEGNLYTLNIPDDFSQLYRLPKDVLTDISRVMTRNLPVFLSADAKYGLFEYDNSTFAVYSFRPVDENLEIILRGDEYKGIVDLETGREYYPLLTGVEPQKRFDAAKAKSEVREQILEVPFTAGFCRFYRLIGKEE